MTEHLSECPHSEPALSPGFLVMCICDRLRACEQRTANKIAALLVEGIDWQDGYAAGLVAAREAVAALDIGRDVRFSVDVRADALAAIDALREKP